MSVDKRNEEWGNEICQKCGLARKIVVHSDAALDEYHPFERAIRLAVEVMRSAPRQHRMHCSFEGQDASCLCGYKRMTDAEIAEELTRRLEGE